MKRIMSISLGCSSRDKKVITKILDQEYSIERIGTNGSIKQAVKLIQEYDGKVDVFGMGGIDIYLGAGLDKPYIIKEALQIKKAAKLTPIVDGSGIKRNIEKLTIKYLIENKIVDFKDKKAFVTCAIDRYKLAESLEEAGSQLVIGDLMFGLNIPIAIKKLSTLKKVAEIAMPFVSKLPFKMLYPLSNNEIPISDNRFAKFFDEADIISGDYIYIKKHMPKKMTEKIIITNTVTPYDVQVLKKAGIKLLVTTTPEFDGRSFGTNVIEALIVSLLKKRPESLMDNNYYDIYAKLGFKPRVEYLN